MQQDDPPHARPKVFGHGAAQPLFVRKRKGSAAPTALAALRAEVQWFEFVMSEDRLDGRGAGSLHPLGMPKEAKHYPFFAYARKYIRMHLRRVRGAAATSRVASDRRHAIQAYAQSIGWPVRGAAKQTIAVFAPIGGTAPKRLRCSERTVKVALAELKLRTKKCNG